VIVLMGNSEFQQQRRPILETVVCDRRVVPQDPGGAFAAFAFPQSPRQIRIRVQADWLGDLVVLLDDAQLPLRKHVQDEPGWYVADAQVLRSSSRKLFWEFVISLPPDKRVDAGLAAPMRIMIFDKPPPDFMRRPPLFLRLIDRGMPGRVPLASDFFNEADGENTKPDGRAERCMIAKGVVIAGWLADGNPVRTDVGPPVNRSNESEDYHYDCWLDNEFIERNYGTPFNLEPVASAIVKGNRTNLVDLRPGREFPLLIGGKINAGSFTWPGNGLFTVELNAWHIAARGEPPAGWAGREPTEPDKDGNAWPFPPHFPLIETMDRSDLAADDYVIMSGTLYQDTKHAGDDDIDRHRACWDVHNPGHGGWLELHPVDSIRRVDPPSPRTTTELVNVCEPGPFQHINRILTPRLNRGETADPDLVLRCQRIVDQRFTPPAPQFLLDESLTSDHPPKLNVTLKTSMHNTAQIHYVIWYEKPDPAHPPPDPASPCGPSPGGTPQPQLPPDAD
jgi:hypothetical protein